MLDLDFDIYLAGRRLVESAVPDLAAQRLFRAVASAAANHNRLMGWQPQLFAFVDAAGAYGSTWNMKGFRNSNYMMHYIRNKLIAARLMRSRSRDARGVLPGAASRVSGFTKLLLCCNCAPFGWFRFMYARPFSPLADAKFLSWINERELFSFGEPGAVPIFNTKGEFVCAIAACGGDGSQDEQAVEAGMREAGIKLGGRFLSPAATSTSSSSIAPPHCACCLACLLTTVCTSWHSGWVWRPKTSGRTPAAGLSMGSQVPRGPGFAEHFIELQEAIETLEMAMAAMEPGPAAMRMQACRLTDG